MIVFLSGVIIVGFLALAGIEIARIFERYNKEE